MNPRVRVVVVYVIALLLVVAIAYLTLWALLSLAWFAGLPVEAI